MLTASTVVRKKPEVGDVRAAEKGVLAFIPPRMQLWLRHPGSGPRSAPQQAGTEPPPLPRRLRIAPGASPRCRRPSSAALLPSSRPPCPAPAAVRGRAQTPEPFGVLQNGLWGLGGRGLRSRPVSKMAAVWLRLGNPAPVRRGGWAPCRGREGRADAIFPERGSDIEGSVGGWREGGTGAAAAAAGFVHRSQGKGAFELVPVGFCALS